MSLAKTNWSGSSNISSEVKNADNILWLGRLHFLICNTSVCWLAYEDWRSWVYLVYSRLEVGWELLLLECVFDVNVLFLTHIKVLTWLSERSVVCIENWPNYWQYRQLMELIFLRPIPKKNVRVPNCTPTNLDVAIPLVTKKKKKENLLSKFVLSYILPKYVGSR